MSRISCDICLSVSSFLCWYSKVIVDAVLLAISLAAALGVIIT